MTVKPTSGMSYALKALVELGLNEGAAPVPLAVIAKRHGIPPRYLEQLFNKLRRSGFVAAARGPGGGYRLKRPAREIPVSDIAECLGNPARPVSASDPAAAVWKQVEKAVKTTLEATTLESLVEIARKERPSPFPKYTFHI